MPAPGLIPCPAPAWPFKSGHAQGAPTIRPLDQSSDAKLARLSILLDPGQDNRASLGLTIQSQASAEEGTFKLTVNTLQSQEHH